MKTAQLKSGIILAVCVTLSVAGVSKAGAQDAISTFAGGGPSQLPATAANVQYPVQTAVDKAGNYYFVSQYQYQHRVFKVSTAGLVTVVAGNGSAGFSGDGGSATLAQLNTPDQVATDSAGNVYIADYNNCVVRKVTVSTGIISTFAGDHAKGCGYSGDGGSAITAQLYNPTGVAVDASNNVYIADASNERVRKVTGGNITTIAGTGTAGFSGDGGAAKSAQIYFPESLTVDGAGNVYIDDFYNHRIRKVTVSSGKITTVAGNGTAGFAGDGGPATGAEFNSPYEIASDSAGNLFIADTSNCAVREVTASTGKISTVAGDHSCGYSGDGSAATSAQVSYPYGVAVDNSDNLYIADYYNYRIRKVTHSTGVITTAAGNGIFYFAGAGTPASGASLYYPYNATSDSSGNIYVADQYNCLVRKVSGGNMNTFAGTVPTVALPSSQCGYSGDGGPATSAKLNYPTKAVTDHAGNVYIVDHNNCVIREVNTGGQISTYAGTGSCGYSGDGGAPRNAQLYYPTGITFDGSGNMYIADTSNQVVRKISGGKISTVAGNHTKGAGFSGDGGAATNAQLYNPNDVAVDASGNLYIADFNNARVRVVYPGGTIGTFAGNGASGFQGDGGPANDTSVYDPASVAVDSAGDVIIGDYYNSRVRWVNGQGVIYTLAGSGTYGLLGDGGLATSAEMTYPAGVGVDPSGNFYIADYNNWRVRKVSAIANLNSSSYNLSFEEQPVGTTSQPQAITLKGVGGLTINSITATGDFTEADDCPTSLPSGSNCNVDVIFTPSAAGTRTGNLVISTNGYFSPTLTIALKGAGAGLMYAPASLNFGGHVVGTTSSPSTITFTNDSTTSVTFSSVTTTKTTFAIASNTCTGTIAGGKTCVIGVTFKPIATGSATATLVVKDSDNSSPQLIPIRGSGLSTSLSPTSLAYGTVPKGSAKTLTTTLTNKGTATLTSISAAVTGTNAGDFALTTTCGTTLAVGASCSYKVTFIPSTTAAESGTLNVKDNENTGTGFPVSLSGVG